MFKRNVEKSELAWKTKYFNSLEELESKEKAWTQLDETMRNAMSRLTILLEGIDKSLDKELEYLRRALRKSDNGANIRNQIRVLLEKLEEVEQRQKQSPRVTSATTLMRLADNVPLPKGTARRLKSLKKSIDKMKDDDSPDKVIAEFIELIRESYGLVRASAKEKFNQAAIPEETPAPNTAPAAPVSLVESPVTDDGVGQRVLGELVNALQVPDTLQQDVALVRERLDNSHLELELTRLARELAKILNDALPGTQQQTLDELEQGGLTINEVLLQLIERIELPNDVSDEVSDIQKALEGEVSDQEWPRLLERISALIRSMREKAQEEKKNLESFLTQLTDQLQTLDDFISGIEADHHESISRGQDMHDQVQDQIRGINESVDEAAELEQLKSLVRQRLDQITEHMTTFRQHEDERDRRAQDRINELNEQIQLMERDSEQLRKKVKQEREQAMMDPLTEVHNRLAYDERIEQEYARWKRYQSPLSLMVIDIDHFKRINDTYGHIAGDKVLHTVAQVLQEKIRETDFLARYGGEEFVIIMPGTAAQEALGVAEKLREEVEHCGFHYREEAVIVTISSGVAEFRSGMNPATVFELADSAMYRAKQDGRNRCFSANNQ